MQLPIHQLHGYVPFAEKKSSCSLITHPIRGTENVKGAPIRKNKASGVNSGRLIPKIAGRTRAFSGVNLMSENGAKMNKLLFILLLVSCTGCTLSFIEMHFPEGSHEEVLDIVIEKQEEPYA
jgi:hypothetical protein